MLILNENIMIIFTHYTAAGVKNWINMLLNSHLARIYYIILLCINVYTPLIRISYRNVQRTKYEL